MDDEPLDWWHERVSAQQNWAEESLRIAVQQRATMSSDEPSGSPKLDKMNWVVGEAQKKHIAEQRYYPSRKTKPRTKHHIYWLSAIAFMAILMVVFAAFSLALTFAPFTSDFVRFFVRLFAPIIVFGLLLAIVVTVIIHYAHKWS